MTTKSRNIVLIADDFAISEGVSAGIARLGEARRISGASALVTLARWPHDGLRLAGLRTQIAVGLHVNLTLGTPLGRLPRLAPEGRLPSVGTLIWRALARQLDRQEVEAEIARQLERFTEITGSRPDFIDGHQHTHALPVVREALISAILHFYRNACCKPLVRLPADTAGSVLSRPGARAKAVVLTGLSAGFARVLASARIPANDSFAGVSGFGSSAAHVRRDLSSALHGARGLHLVMCHPGVPSEELAALDPITTRRAAELEVLAQDNVATPHICHPCREGGDGLIDWSQVALGAR